MKPIHKYNGGAGATLCHQCRVIITTGLTEDLYCSKCGPNKTTYHNRYRDAIQFEHIDNKVIMTGGKWFRYGIADDDSINMVDPSGGPYIELGDNLKEFFMTVEHNYQDLIINKIELEFLSEETHESKVTFTVNEKA
jgi:hypothetical protein